MAKFSLFRYFDFQLCPQRSLFKCDHLWPFGQKVVPQIFERWSTNRIIELSPLQRKMLSTYILRILLFVTLSVDLFSMTCLMLVYVVVAIKSFSPFDIFLCIYSQNGNSVQQILCLYSQTPLIRPSLIRLFTNPARIGLEQIFSYSYSAQNCPGTNGGGLRRSDCILLHVTA